MRKFLGHYLYKTLIGVAVTICFYGLYSIDFHILDALEKKSYDYRYLIRGAKSHNHDVVIATIDDKSLSELGRWPWPRSIMIDLVEKLSDFGSALIVFDVLYPEADKSDEDLGVALYDAGNVLLPVNFDLSEKELPEAISGYLYRNRIMTVHNEERFHDYAPVQASGVIMPVDVLVEGAIGLGHINIVPDTDGVLRWDMLVVDYGGYKFPNISVVAAAYFLGSSPAELSVDATKSVNIGDKRVIPTDRWGRALVNYSGPVDTYKYFSIADILKDKYKPEEFEGKIVLIGSSAVGAYDLRVTPYSAVMPGVEKHASMINSIIANDFIQKVEGSTDKLFIVLFGLIFSLIAARLKAWSGTLLTLSATAAILLAGYLTFKNGYWLTVIYPVFTISTIFVFQIIYSYAVEERSGRKIKGLFSSYVTERVVEQLIKNPELAKLGGYRQEVSVLFSDIESFTNYSEKHTPEQVVAQLNEYLSAMTDVIMDLDGTLDKFVGDEIMAFWGAPVDQEDHAVRAVQCAVNMLIKLKELQDKWESEGRALLSCGVGVNTGEVLVGNIGAESKKMDYTIIGDNVNLGARLEAITRNYDTKIVISEFTYAKVKDKIEGAIIEELDEVQVKGKENKVVIYSVKPI